jgi:hypothetical protein
MVPGAGSAAGAAPALALAAVGSGQEQVQGGQVRQDAVLADKRALRPPGSGALALVWPRRQR